MMAKRKPMYAIVDIPRRGKGIVATKNITKGSRILEEKPVITTPEQPQSDEWLKTNIAQQVSCLNDHQRQSFFSMHNLYAYQSTAEQALGIIRTNSLPIEANGIGGGIFLEACRINHACDDNAQKYWNRRIERHTVHALKDILKGEEITIYYLAQAVVAKCAKRDSKKSLISCVPAGCAHYQQI
jgi:SET domain-containing protein